MACVSSALRRYRCVHKPNSGQARQARERQQESQEEFRMPLFVLGKLGCSGGELHSSRMEGDRDGDNHLTGNLRRF